MARSLSSPGLSTTQNLPAKQLLVLEGSRSRSTKVACVSGLLWITEKNSGDILLRQGQSYRSSCDCKMLVQALTDSALQLEG